MANPAPLFPNEVVDIILGHLQNRQLLECRLVSKSWNELSLKHLKRVEHIQELKIEKVKGFMNFLKEFGSVPRFPLKIRFGIGPTLTPELLADVDSLITWAGRNSIAELDWRWTLIDHSTLPSICSLLERISCELLTFTKPNNLTSQLIQDFVARIQSLTFPKLKELRLTSDLGVGTEYVFSILIRKCPNIKVLCMEGLTSTAELRLVPFEIGLETLKLLMFSTSNIQHVQYLQALANQIELKSFTCDFFLIPTWEPPENNTMNQLMELLSPKLRSFSYSITNGYHHLITSPFPVLNRLKIFLAKFRLSPKFTESGSPIPRSLTPILLPALKSVAVPIGIYWNSPEDLPVIGSVVDLTLQAHIWQTSSGGLRYISALELQNCLANVFRVFPNTIRLTLRRWNCWGYSTNLPLDFRRLILGVMVYPNEGRIRELTVEDYSEDYLGKNFFHLKNSPAISNALDKASFPGHYASGTYVAGISSECLESLFDSIDFQIGDDSKTLRMDTSGAIQESLKIIFLKNISKFTILLPLEDLNKLVEHGFQVDFKDDQSQLLENTPWAPRRILYLDHISKCFPSLRVLEMSTQILSSNYLTAWKLAREIESVYPTWAVNLTHTPPEADD